MLPQYRFHIDFSKETYAENLAKIASELSDLCLVLLKVPKCFGLVQNFCARPKIYLRIVAVTNILCQTKRWFAYSKIGFCAITKVFEEAINAVKFLGWLKKFGPAQNILGLVKGQDIYHACPLKSQSIPISFQLK